MQFYNPDEPKGGHGTMPPLNTPLVNSETRLNAYISGLNFLSDLAGGGGGGAEARFALVVSPLNP